MTAFDEAFSALIANEGGYSNNPADPGGETMWGVTAAIARKHGYDGPMASLPLSAARAIAKAEYWDSIRGDELDPQVAFQVFDASYNSGPVRAVTWLQQAAGAISDGAFGPATMKAVQTLPPGVLMARFNGIRLEFMADLAMWPTFSRGWARRISSNLKRINP